MSFKSGDQLVHPQHGLGRVIRLEARQFGEKSRQRYYEISIPAGTVWVPVGESDNGLRKITDKNDLGRYRGVLRGRPSPLSADNKQRKIELAERMKATSFQARCEVLRDLSAHGWRRPLNESTGSLLRAVRQLLCTEWAAAEERPLDEATREVDALLLEGKKTYGP